jgi:hypothetical protein
MTAWLPLDLGRCTNCWRHVDGPRCERCDGPPPSRMPAVETVQARMALAVTCPYCKAERGAPCVGRPHHIRYVVAAEEGLRHLTEGGQP